MGCSHSLNHDSADNNQSPIWTQNRYIATLISNMPEYTETLIEIENELSGLPSSPAFNVQTLYTAIVEGTLPAMKSGEKLSMARLYVYHGLVGLHYGPNSPEYDAASNALFRYSQIDMSWARLSLSGPYIEFSSDLEYNTNFDQTSNQTVVPDTGSWLFLGEWATGHEHSNVVLREAHRVAPDIHTVIHTGSVHYSGTVREQNAKLVKPLKRYFPKATIRCLRGERDTYSGPTGFHYVQQSFGQQSSYFSISNRYVVLQGMDTTYPKMNKPTESATIPTASVAHLVDDEVSWHDKMIRQSKLSTKKPKKVVVVSHHAPITLNETEQPVNRRLCSQLSTIIPHIDAYLFGHENRFMLYQDYKFRNGLVLKKPRLIGHGSVSVPNLSKSPDGPNGPNGPNGPPNGPNGPNGANLEVLNALATDCENVPDLVESGWEITEDQHLLVKNDWMLGYDSTNKMTTTGFCILRCVDGKVTISYYNILQHTIFSRLSKPRKVYETKCVYVDHL